MKKIIPTFLGTALLMSNAILAEEDTTPSREFTFDLAAGGVDESFSFSKETKVKLVIKNMVPGKRDSYVIKIDEQLVTPEPLTAPSSFTEKESGMKEKRIPEALIPDPCSKVEAAAKALYLANSESQIPDLLSKLKTEDALLAKVPSAMVTPDISDAVKNAIVSREKDRGKSNGMSTAEVQLAIIAAEKNREKAVNAQESAKKQHEECKAIYPEALKQTLAEKEFTAKADTKYTVSVSFATTNYGQLVLEPEETWITHVGFAFVDNKDQNYFSREIPGMGDAASTYRVTEADSGDDWDYVAMAMFTYPFLDFSNDGNWQLGVTGGLGTDSENIAVSAGVSLVIYKNFMLTLSAVGTEFDVLKGRYRTNMDLGETSIEAADLVEQTFKFSPAITLSYRFGD